MTLLDCALCFFANFPCRLTVSEMRFDLPSEEHFYASRHPFAEPNFTPNRHLTAFEAYQSLFGYQKPPPSPIQERKGNPLGLNPMDMFILIHCMFYHNLLMLELHDLRIISALRLYTYPHNAIFAFASTVT
jgi:hypothetical protein